MIQNRGLRIVASAVVASVVGLISVVALGFLVGMVLIVAVLPQSTWTEILLGALLAAVFGFSFIISFRETLNKLTPE